MSAEHCRLPVPVPGSAIPVRAEDDGLLGEGNRVSINAVKEIASL